ncbi:metallophosphatase family protein [Halalkalibacillus sediminis]|uniref:Metallophosphatase family protein n=1 Tax=Halalkalibacillus sediminis TaxID=2018042 RepID=A0A2I0QTD9_9BACI|nr:metallophosphoesterase family protein [Halalkalibacillus sediminis]PKR77607.1 metallophosphatase family protein [Halalkalibacillus sediminis]
MEKIAIISDIHGNKTALDAVLGDIEKRSVDRIFCLGDLIGKGPQGSACIATVKEKCDKVIRGNWDVFIQEETDNEFLQWYKDRLTEDDYNFLKNLPFNIDIELNEQLIRCVHASPRSEFERILPWHPLEDRLTMFENSDATGTSSSSRKPDIVLYGDIHTSFLHTYSNGILCNVGSVGNSLDLNKASYVIIDGSHGTNGIEFVRVDYDREAEVGIARDLGMPGLEPYRGEIMFAKYRHA